MKMGSARLGYRTYVKKIVRQSVMFAHDAFGKMRMMLLHMIPHDYFVHQRLLRRTSFSILALGTYKSYFHKKLGCLIGNSSSIPQSA